MTTASLPHTTEIGMDHDVAEKIADALKAAQPNATRYHEQLDRALDYLKRGFSFTVRGPLLECQSQTSNMGYRTELLLGCNCPGYTYNGHCFHGALLTIALTYHTVRTASLPFAVRPEPVPPPTAPAYTYTPGPARTRMSDAEYADLCRRLDDECF